MYLELGNLKFGSPVKKIDTTEIGGSGTSVYGGVVSDIDYNIACSGQERFVTYERMRKSDPLVGGALKFIELMLQEAEWVVEGKDEKIREFAEEAVLKKPSYSWRETLHNILLMLPFGFSVLEKVFVIEDNMVWWDKLAPRHPSTIYKWSKEGKKGVEQRLSGEAVGAGGTTPFIPIEKLLIFSNDKEGDNWEGTSLLRSAYKPFFFKEHFEKISAIGYERQSVGVPLFNEPLNATPEDRKRADEIGKNLRVNEKAYVRLPYGWELEILGMKGNETKDPADAIQRCNFEILVSIFFQQFLMLGSGKVGSFALSKDQSTRADFSVRALASQLCETINDHGIKQLIDLNFGEQDEYPRLKAKGIGSIDVNEFSNAIERMSRVGAITKDFELEQHLRSLLKLPEKDEEEYRRQEDEKKKMQVSIAQSPADEPIDKDTGKKQTPESKKRIDDKNKEVKGSEVSGKTMWRPLTAAEQKIDWNKLQGAFDSLINQYGGAIKQTLFAEREHILSLVKEALEHGDAGQLTLLDSVSVEELRAVINGAIAESFELGKLTASNEMKVDAVATGSKVNTITAAKAQAMAEEITSELITKSKAAVIEHIERDTSIAAAIRDVENKIISIIDRNAGIHASQAVVGGINSGRGYAFDANIANIYGLQRSELLDSRTCSYCLSIDGRVVEPDDALGDVGQFHKYCRGIWVEIMKEEEDKPEIGGVPDYLRRHVGGLDDFVPVAEAEPLEDSMAEDYVNAYR